MPDLATQRLMNQHLARPTLDPVALVAAFGAMQAQEYEHAKWALGLRAPATREIDIEALLVRGEILRSHPMRGTHHFVARADLRWLMALMGPIMIARSANRNRQLELDEKTLARAMTAIDRALADDCLTRAEVATVLRRARITSDGQRLAHIIYRAELEAVGCSGPRKGKQITLARFADRVGNAKPRSREDSLRELARRYFTTRGPATLADFRWWCQLPAADARAAVELAAPDEDAGYYSLAPTRRSTKAPRALLLPPFDEYTVAYVDRTHAGTGPKRPRTFGESTLLGPTLVIDGIAVGSWRRTHKRGGTTVEITPWRKLAAGERVAAEDAVARYVTWS